MAELCTLTFGRYVPDRLSLPHQPVLGHGGVSGEGQRAPMGTQQYYTPDWSRRPPPDPNGKLFLSSFWKWNIKNCTTFFIIKLWHKTTYTCDSAFVDINFVIIRQESTFKRIVDVKSVFTIRMIGEIHHYVTFSHWL